ncbi:MAG: hypothetical protein HYY87_04060 [Candidatus Levybacteria bacterium]|nr:hypothetical protein [Candidatus Levybacteria bacterium]MBI3092973.1 hypothetical protein [Candidatus Levybacteria bacterium]
MAVRELGTHISPDSVGVSFGRTPEDTFRRLIAKIPNHEEIAYRAVGTRGLLPPDGKLILPPHNHGNGSAATYIGDWRVSTESGHHRVLLAMQDQGGRTSLHVHTQPNMPELYVRLWREGVSYVNVLELDGDLILGRKRILMSDEGIIVPPGVPHFVDTENGTFSYTLIVMRNAGDIPYDQHHTPLVARLPGEATPHIIRAQDIDHRIPLL